MTKRAWLLTCGMAFALGIGCLSQNTGTPSSGPTDWTVTTGSSGGFTGGGSGYEIHGDGKVRSWTRITPKDSVTTSPIGTASDSTLAALYAAMTSSELRAIHLAETGNMTAMLDWARGGESLHYSWPEGTAPPVPVARARDAAQAAVRDAQANR